MAEQGLKLNEYYLQPGFIFFSRIPTVISSVLGSCVAVSLWDRQEGYGGMVHYLYPSFNGQEKTTARYGNAAIHCLARMFIEEGARRNNVQAQIFGGASTADEDCRRIAEENIEMARTALRKLKIKIVSEDVGGDMGRKIVYNTSTNETIVYKSGKLRRGDWYPYVQSDRS